MGKSLGSSEEAAAILRPYRVTTSMGAVTVLARTLAAAIIAGLELTGPGARLLSCLQEGDW